MEESENESTKVLEEEFEETNKSFENVEKEQEDQKIQRVLEPQDTMQAVYNCGRVEGMDKRGNVLLLINI